MSKNSNLSNHQPNDIATLKSLLYDQCHFELTNLIIEKESKAYQACTFKLNGLNILFRKAKITPTKTGQFVTLWKRETNGPIQPFEVSDEIDLFVINTRSGNDFGQFVFPKTVLSQHVIVSTDTKEGKRAIRVYPPWDTTTSKQAQKTQKWQLEYFLSLDIDKPIDLNRAKTLYQRFS